jgi:hypothetical protein
MEGPGTWHLVEAAEQRIVGRVEGDHLGGGRNDGIVGTRRSEGEEPANHRDAAASTGEVRRDDRRGTGRRDDVQDPRPQLVPGRAERPVEPSDSLDP